MRKGLAQGRDLFQRLSSQSAWGLSGSRRGWEMAGEGPEGSWDGTRPQWQGSEVVGPLRGGASGHRGLISRRDKVSSGDPEPAVLRALFTKDGVAPLSLYLPVLPLHAP